MTVSDTEVSDDLKFDRGDAAQQETPAKLNFVTIGGESPSAESLVPVNKKLPLIPIVAFVIFCMVAAAGAAVLVAKRSTTAQAPVFQDLGAGISNATGLKGNLQVRWQDSAQYQLKIEPLHRLQGAGFSLVAAHPPSQLSINIRLLDVTGFAVCNKEIRFHIDSANDNGNSQDVFQNFVGEDGAVDSISAQGILPCTAEQFRQINYWDFSTDFPTLDEQDALLKRVAAKAWRAAEAKAALRNPRVRSGFSTEGDDRAMGYDSSRGTLEARLGRNFVVTRTSDRAIANAWVANNALFHYKCDQRSRCLLTHAGGAETIAVMALQ